MNKQICVNRKAFHEYNILEKHTCGIVLHGSEVKSIRLGKSSINEAYCFIDDNNEIFIKGMHIAPYEESGKHNNHLPLRDKKLLMKKKEIIKLHELVSQKGLTLIPLSVMLSPSGFIKIEIGLGKGKHLYDKKAAIREKDIKRDLERNNNN